MRKWSWFSFRTFPGWVSPYTSISSSRGLRAGAAGAADVSGAVMADLLCLLGEVFQCGGPDAGVLGRGVAIRSTGALRPRLWTGEVWPAERTWVVTGWPTLPRPANATFILAHGSLKRVDRTPVV